MRAARHYPTARRRHDASDTRIGDLLYLARQFRQWSTLFALRGETGTAKAHAKKCDHAIKALRTLGYTGEI